MIQNNKPYNILKFFFFTKKQQSITTTSDERPTGVYKKKSKLFLPSF